MKAARETAGLQAAMAIVMRLVFLTLLVLPSGAAIAGEPTDQVRGTVDQVLAVLREPNLDSPEGKKERRDRLNEIISARFDFAEMARRSLGAEWRRITPEQQQEFVELFTELLRNAYTGNIDSYKGEKVSYTRETRDENYAVVETMLQSPEGAQYAIDYRLQLFDGEWKVYDVVIENISMVNNYRAQFTRVINRSTFDGLLRALRDRVEKS
jgi:phospholipid transport system substrate-binding protein